MKEGVSVQESERAMKIAYFDCFSGASGDMILGAMVDAGLSPRALSELVKKLKLSTIRLRVKKVQKNGISATRVVVEGKEERSHRTLKEILKIIERSELEAKIKEKSREVFDRLARVEGQIHGTSPEEVHFHELGGLDSVVDIVGAVWGLREMGIGEIYVSRVNVGTGFVRCEHGLLPVPAPAALALMKGKPIYSSGVEKELLTPTGAAILTTLGKEFGRMPPMKVDRIGYGAGREDLPHPNLLRLIVGTSGDAWDLERVFVIETNIDDMNPQFYDYLIDALLGMGAFDVFLTPIMMKKNRPGTLLTIIAPSQEARAMVDFLLQETTTLGLRWREEERARADREIVRLMTKYGKMRFKLARWEGKVVNFSPEYEDCKRLAIEAGVPLKKVYEEANKVATVFQQRQGKARGNPRG